MAAARSWMLPTSDTCMGSSMDTHHGGCPLVDAADIRHLKAEQHGHTFTWHRDLMGGSHELGRHHELTPWHAHELDVIPNSEP